MPPFVTVKAVALLPTLLAFCELVAVAVTGGASKTCDVIRSDGLTLWPWSASRNSAGGSSGGSDARVCAREAWKSGSAALKLVVGSIRM